MEINGVLSLLGLALRGGNLTVGEEPVEAVARARDARVLLLAADAADNTCRRVQRFAEMGQCIWLRLPCNKAELGRALGRSAAAVVAVTDIGLAGAVVRKLAELDPVRYDEAAVRLELKAKRAAERRAEQLAHEKNVRTGKVRRKAPPVRPELPKQGEPSRRETPGRPRNGKGRDTARDAWGGKPRDTARSGKPGERGKGPTDRPRRTGPNPYAHSRPVKKGKGSFRRKGD